MFCDSVPEIDVIFKDQLGVYLQSNEVVNSKTSSLQGQVNLALRHNTDGTICSTNFDAMMPTALYIEQNEVFKSLYDGLNVVVILLLFLLATLVVYSLMISDVNE